ncbi:hypothetical protein [Sodalis sp. RH16]|uniref:hypothetical protein n=1 Tax=Sodalis sp. RH16 TaxID=3394331 RepID=UPI0039B60177
MMAMGLLEYIKTYFGGNQSEFARHMGVNRQKVNGWINDNWIVFDGKLYSPRREVSPP